MLVHLRMQLAKSGMTAFTGEKARSKKSPELGTFTALKLTAGAHAQT